MKKRPRDWKEFPEKVAI